MLEGGHADNALLQLARATVNCRMFPGSKVDDVRRALAMATGDSAVVVKPIPPSPSRVRRPLVRRDLLDILDNSRRATSAGRDVVVPAMETGASDGLFFATPASPRTIREPWLATPMTIVRTDAMSAWPESRSTMRRSSA
ncbi:MAG: hypothetical protein U0163_09060 [Gemmatimonadaceae bacterium]